MSYGHDEIDTTSRELVKKNGEVFTPFVIVSQMLALIPDSYWNDQNAVFLEPTSGNGQFLVKVFEKRINHGIDIETALNTMIGMEINQQTLLQSHARLYERVCAQMMVQGIKPQSKQWYEMAIRCVAIIRNNVFKVTDSLKVMSDYYKGKGTLATKKFVFSDPTGNNDVMSKSSQDELIKKIKESFRSHKDGKKTETLSIFFKVGE